MANLSLQEILDKTIWVVRLPAYRMTGTYQQVKKYSEDKDCLDFDIACAGGQPKELQDFYTSYEAYGNKHGFITVQDYYKKWISGE